MMPLAEFVLIANRITAMGTSLSFNAKTRYLGSEEKIVFRNCRYELEKTHAPRLFVRSDHRCLCEKSQSMRGVGMPLTTSTVTFPWSFSLRMIREESTRYLLPSEPS